MLCGRISDTGLYSFCSRRIRLLSTCLIPKFRVPRPHRRGIKISLGTKSFINYEIIYFSGLKPSRKNILATDVGDRCDVKSATFDSNQNAVRLDYNKHCDVTESHHSDECWVSPWCLDFFVKMLHVQNSQKGRFRSEFKYSNKFSRLQKSGLKKHPVKEKKSLKFKPTHFWAFGDWGYTKANG